MRLVITARFPRVGLMLEGVGTQTVNELTRTDIEAAAKGFWLEAGDSLRKRFQHMFGAKAEPKQPASDAGLRPAWPRSLATSDAIGPPAPTPSVRAARR